MLKTTPDMFTQASAPPAIITSASPRRISSSPSAIASPPVAHALDLVPSGPFFDMPALFDALVRKGMRARCHHIEGYWLDIGRMPDYERANMDFAEFADNVGADGVFRGFS